MNERPQPAGWTRVAYEGAIETGLIGRADRVELLGGRLMVAEPQGSRHAATVSLVADALRAAFGAGWYVMVQLPVALDEESEPEPDVAVVAGTARQYWDAHPSRPVLVVEVADSSMPLDRGDKASLYARAGVPDYWIVDIARGVVEVHRQPEPLPSAPYGWGYGHIGRLGRDAVLSPVAAATSRVALADFLP
jgi:Uma2 family endonuclease